MDYFEFGVFGVNLMHKSYTVIYKHYDNHMSKKLNVMYQIISNIA